MNTKALAYRIVHDLQRNLGLDVSMDSNANGVRLENVAGDKSLSDRMTISQMHYLLKGIYLGRQLEREKQVNLLKDPRSMAS